MSDAEVPSTSVAVDKSALLLPTKCPTGKPPFRLWFSLTREIGRSNLSTSSPLGLVPGVTGKFYSLRETNCEGEPNVEAVKKVYEVGPKQKFPGHYPPLESHKYGWYSEVTFTSVDIMRDRKLNYHKRSLPMFKTPTLSKK